MPAMIAIAGSAMHVAPWALLVPQGHGASRVSGPATLSQG